MSSSIVDQSRLARRFDDLLHLTDEQEDYMKASPPPPPPPPALKIGNDIDDSQEEEDEDEDDDDEDWDLCQLCRLDRNHRSNKCPYRKFLPAGAKLGPDWVPACRMCLGSEFVGPDSSCIWCHCVEKLAVPLICGICSESGHDNDDCPHKDSYEMLYYWRDR